MSNINWAKLNENLNNIFNNASFEYLNKMGIYPEPDEDGNYDKSLEEIHNEWDLSSAQDKLDKIMEVSGYSETDVYIAIDMENYYFLQ